MKKTKIRAKAYTIVIIIWMISLIMGIFAGIVAGGIEFWNYIKTQTVTTSNEIIIQMRKDLNDVY